MSCAWDHKTKQAYQALQNCKLREFIQTQVYPFSPHYKKLFDERGIKPKHIQTVKDLQLLPFTEKTDMVDPNNPLKLRDFILQPDEEKIKHSWPLKKLLPLLFKKITRGKEKVKADLAHEYRPLFLTSTTGRTNVPISFFYSPYDLERLAVAGVRLIEVMDQPLDGRVVNIFPYAPHLAFWQVAFAGFKSGLFILSTGGGKVMGTQGNIASILKAKPDSIVGVPGYIYHLLREATHQKADFSCVKKAVLGAEKVPPGLKEKMKELLVKLGAKDPFILGTYGFTEARMAWAECPAHESTGYHTYPDMEIFEIVNPDTGEPLAEGESGEIVYTCLDARASCVLRFRTRDYAVGGITWQPCPACGRTVPRISSNITRRSNIQEFNLSKIKGTLVNLNVFSDILANDRDIEEWQIEIRKKENDPYQIDELAVYLSLRDNSQEAAIKDRITQKMKAETEISPNEIKTLPLDELLKKVGMETELKEKRIIDTRPKAA